MQEFKLYIDGMWSEGTSGVMLEDLNPATGEIFAKVCQASEEDVEKAIQAASRAAKDWKKTLVKERERILLKAADYMKDHAEEFAEWLIDESGSAWTKTIAELHDSANMIRSAAAAIHGIHGGVIQGDAKDQFSWYIRQPLGVVVGIAPYNYPVYLAVDKVGYAIAAGNSFILKPASYTPVSGLVIARCFHEAGLPAGVLNILVGSGSEIGDRLIQDPRTKMIAFTGSSSVGLEIAKKASVLLKRYTLELGGKNPLIVLNGYDVNQAADAALIGAYFHSGQICMATNRIIVEEGIYQEFCEIFARKVREIPFGDPHKHDTLVGPLIHENQCKILDDHIADAISKGARLLTGGSHRGAFYEPSLLVDVTPEMDIFYEESFGPLTCVVCGKDDMDALRLANDNKYGLSSAIMTNDINQALWMAEELEAGMVHINESTVVGSSRAPFGGIKKSGVGREGLCSIEEFTEVKWITAVINKG